MPVAAVETGFEESGDPAGFAGVCSEAEATSLAFSKAGSARESSEERRPIQTAAAHRTTKNRDNKFRFDRSFI